MTTTTAYTAAQLRDFITQLEREPASGSSTEPPHREYTSAQLRECVTLLERGSVTPLREEAPPSLADLRAAAAAAHPDRGGDPEEFRVAHARYRAAKEASR